MNRPFPLALVGSMVLAAACSSLPNEKSTPELVGGASTSSDAPRANARQPFGPPSLRSGLRIPPGERFVFAGGQPSGFVVCATNEGPVPVAIAAELGGERFDVATLGPGEKATVAFVAQQAAIFENPSNREARVRAEVWGPTEVGMRYVPMTNE